MKRQYKVGYITSNGDKYLDDVKQALINKGVATEDTPNSELDDIINDLSQGGGGSVEVPPVTDLALNKRYVLTFTKPDLSGLIEQGAVISYLVTINGTTIEVQDSGVNIGSHIKYGENEISVIVKVVFNSESETTNIVLSEPIITITTLSTTLPNREYNMGAVTVNNDIYILGGINKRGYKFNATTETITTLNVTLPSSSIGVGNIISVNTNIYILSGKQIYKFDTVSETITTLSVTASLSFSYSSSISIGNNIYTFGSYNAVDTINKFDTVSETITTLNVTLPVALNSTRTALVNDDIYILGGSTGSDRIFEIYKFNATTETITTLNVTLPTTIVSFTPTSVNDNIYFFGVNDGTSATNKIYKFDTVSETITELSVTLPKPLYLSAASAVNENSYIFGGYDGQQNATNTIYKFNEE